MILRMGYFWKWVWGVWWVVKDSTTIQIGAVFLASFVFKSLFRYFLHFNLPYLRQRH